MMIPEYETDKFKTFITIQIGRLCACCVLSVLLFGSTSIFGCCLAYAPTIYCISLAYETLWGLSGNGHS